MCNIELIVHILYYTLNTFLRTDLMYFYHNKNKHIIKSYQYIKKPLRHSKVYICLEFQIFVNNGLS